MQPPNRILLVEDEFILAEDLRQMVLGFGHEVVGVGATVSESLALLKAESPDLVILDIMLGRNPGGLDIAEYLQAERIPFIFLSSHVEPHTLNRAKATRPDAFLVKPPTPAALEMAIDLALSKSAYRRLLEQDQENQLLLRIHESLLRNEVWSEQLLRAGDLALKLRRMAGLLKEYLPFQLLTFRLPEPFEAGQWFAFREVTGPELDLSHEYELSEELGLDLSQFRELIEQSREAQRLSEQQLLAESAKHPIDCELVPRYRFRSKLFLPLRLQNDRCITLSFYSMHEEYRSYHLNLLERIRLTLQLAIDNALAFEKLAQNQQRLALEKAYLQEALEDGREAPIVGTSASMREVVGQIERIAHTDTTVLLTGETGTGKEVFARLIHQRSPRADHTLIRVNCAAIPEHLIESELFGHEKGAFTGAHQQHIGKFEIADGSTLLLDEIGEIPLNLQSKLLRVLQEKEIERVGGNRSIPVDVRIIAATNRNLRQEVQKGRFRSDLYYRLHVLPIELPSLRARPEDIPLFAHHFTQRIGKKIGKDFQPLSVSQIQRLQAYSWPGNVRELEHLIERAALLAPSNRLEVDHYLPNTPETEEAIPPSQGRRLQTLAENERELILLALQHTNGKIRGEDGAAHLLDIKPTTLESRMKRLGIRRTFV